MSAVYTKRFLAVAGTTSGGQATVPAGRVWIVRDVSVICTSGVASDQIVANFLGGPGFWSALLGTAEFFHSAHWDGHLGLVAGESVGLAVIRGTWSGAITGYEFAA